MSSEVQKRRAVAEDFWCFACSVQRVWTLSEGEARKITPAASSPPPCVLIEPMAGAARVSYDKVSEKRSRPTTWPSRKRLPEREAHIPRMSSSPQNSENRGAPCPLALRRFSKSWAVRYTTPTPTTRRARGAPGRPFPCLSMLG